MAGNLSLTRTYDRFFSIVRDELASNTIFDNVSTKTALLFAMKMMGMIHVVGGRPHLRFTIMKELPTTIGYNDLDPLTPERADPATSAIFEWKQLATPIQVSGLDMIKTEGAGIVDLLELFMNAAEASQREALGGSSVGIFSSADETNLRALTGLQNFLTSSTTTGTVGNLSRVTLAVWRHQSGNVSSDFSANGLPTFRTLYRQTHRWNENVDLIVLNGSTMDNFERDLTSTFQVNLPLGFSAGDQSMIDAGFANMRYKNALMFDDDGVPANTGYFLNSKYTGLYVREGRESEIGDFVKAQNKDDLVSYVLFAGNLCTTNLARQGILLNSDTY